MIQHQTIDASTIAPLDEQSAQYRTALLRATVAIAKSHCASLRGDWPTALLQLSEAQDATKDAADAVIPW